MLSRIAFIGLVALLPTLVADTETIDLDRCIAGKCQRNGRYRQVLITDEYFIVYLDANRCPGKDTYCPTSYGGFSAPDGTTLDSGEYVPGEKTRGIVRVYVPRQYKGLYVKGINGSSRDDFLALTDFEDFSRARAVKQVRPDFETSLDALFAGLAQAYTDKDAGAAGEVYAEDAAYMPPNGKAVRGRNAIVQGFVVLFETAREQDETLALTFEPDERVVEGRLAYETGGYTLTRRGPQGERQSRGKYVVVARFTRGTGWRFQVEAFLPTP